MDFTAKYTDSSEEKIMLRKINDLIHKSEKTYSVTYSHFLTPAEQTLLSKVDKFYGYIQFDGGYEDAERRLCHIQTEEYAVDDGLPIVLLSVTASANDAVISHRDVLGSLMGLGIKREMLGDILASNTRTAQFFCHQSVAEYIEMNLQKIGRYTVKIKQAKLSDLPEPNRKKVSINVSSMRLDSVCGECFGLSRTKAAELIRKGVVSVNWIVIDNISHEIHSGDKIAMKGKGKIEVGEITGTSKKGRLFVEIFKYV